MRPPNVFALSDLERAMEAAGKAGSLELVVATSQHRNPQGRKFLKKPARLPGIGGVQIIGGRHRGGRRPRVNNANEAAPVEGEKR